jgi:hypothetical protein
MSAFTGLDRARSSRPRRGSSDHEPRRAWIGADLSGDADPRQTRALIPLLIVALGVALAVAALRIDLIRTRYAVAAAMDEEQALLEEQRALIVRRRQLRDPVELAVQARQRGFRPASRIFAMPDPASSLDTRSTDRPSLPDVAAAPREDARR